MSDVREPEGWWEVLPEGGAVRLARSFVRTARARGRLWAGPGGGCEQGLGAAAVARLPSYRASRAAFEFSEGRGR